MTPRTPRSLAAAWVLIGACATAPVVQAQSAQALHLRSLAATCANCHNTDGQALPDEAMARLAGLEAGYIAAQMRAFRDGKRPATVMHQIAKGYSEAQIDALAGYFAARK